MTAASTEAAFALMVAGIEADDDMPSHLHEIVYGTPGLGWAWDTRQEFAPSVVTINGEPCVFDPITRSVTRA